MGHLTIAYREPETFSDGAPFTTLHHFEVSVGTASGVYTQVINVGKETSYTVYGLTVGTRYYMAVRAYDHIGNVSNYSAEASALALEDPAVGKCFFTV